MKNFIASRNKVVVLTVVVLMLCAPPLSRAALVAAWGYNSRGQIVMPQSARNVKAVACGYYHNLALKTDGTVVTWGDGQQGAVPVGLSNVTAIAAGMYHNMALRSDGTVVLWSSSPYGETNSLPGLSGVSKIAAGQLHNVALKHDGGVVVWGAGNSGQTNLPPDLTNVVAIAAAAQHTVALKSDGSVVAWGGNAFGQTNVPPWLSNVTAIASGPIFNLALRSDGTVAGWGTMADTLTNFLAASSNVMTMAAGIDCVLLVKDDGTVSSWSSDVSGLATPPLGLSNVTSVAAGLLHEVALTFGGPVQIFESPQNQTVLYGSNLTLTVVTDWTAPLSIRWYRNGTRLTDSATVSGSAGTTLTVNNVVSTDAGIYTVVVSNALSSVSASATVTVVRPPYIVSQSANQIVGAGMSVTFSVSTGGMPLPSCQWMLNGTNLPGRTQNNIFIANAQPEHSGNYTVIASNVSGTASATMSLVVTNRAPFISQQTFLTTTDQRTTLTSPLLVGSSAALNVSATGNLPMSYQWKLNGVDIPGATNSTLLFSQLRYDQSGFYNVEVSNAFGLTNSVKLFLNVVQVYVWDTKSGSAPYTPTNVPTGLTNVTAVAAGHYHLLALRSDGRVTTWANRSDYYTASATSIPPSATNVSTIAASSFNSMALRSNGTVVVWGENSSGQTNVPATVTNVTAIAAGDSFCLALRSNGTVAAWGYNLFGQTVVPANLSNVIAIAAGSVHGLALKVDGRVVAWGGNPYGQTNVPTGLSNVIAVAAGRTISLALKADGSITTWGQSDGTVPTNLTNLVAFAFGTQNNFGLRSDGSLVSWFNGQTISTGVLSNAVSCAASQRDSFSAAVIGNGSPVVVIQPGNQTATRSNTVQLHARAVGVQPMQHQWLLDNQPLPGATNASLILPNILGKDTGAYRMIASNALGVASSQIANVSVTFNTNLAAALGTTNWQWSNVGTPNWFVQNRETHDGDTAAQSGATTNNGQSSLQGSYVPGAGTLSFWWKVSSEEGFDFLRVYVDQSTTPLMSISGETGWEQRTLTFTNGTHTVRWVYSKDGSVSAGRDAGWLDEVMFTPAPPVITQQPVASRTLNVGTSISYGCTVSGVGPLSYQWFKDGNSMIGMTQLNLSLTNLNRRHSATYRVQVSNAGGNVMSSNAALKVLVPQRLDSARRAADGGIEITSRDSDGGTLTTNDLPLFEAQASTNLIHWQTLSDVLSVTNGSLLLRDPAASQWPQRFYRVLEH